MSTKIDADVALEICSHEGLVRQAYKDSVGVLTWSFGVTNASGHKVDRYIGKPASVERCIEVYLWLLETKYAPAVREVFASRDITKAQFAAALSFHWNTGSIKKAAWPKLWLAGDPSARSRFLSSWSKPAAIIPRRKAEQALFFDGHWSNDGTVTEWTRVTSAMHPDWSSGKKINIRADVEAALNPEGAST